MDINNLKIKIKETGYLENKKIGMYFTVKYPHLHNEILEVTKSINESYLVNTYLRARVKFLFEYNLDINKIKKDGQWLTFDRKYDDFIDKTGDYRKRGWSKIQKLISSESYTKEETINYLLIDEYYLRLMGKSKNRTLIKENSKLYNSILEHTKFMDGFHTNNKKFSSRVLVLINHNGDEENIKCKKCKTNFTSFNYKIMDYNNLCYSCFHYGNKNKFPQRGWFKNKYPNTWELEYNNFIIKNTLMLNKNVGYSKISQKIFWALFDRLTFDEQEKTYFKELNDEWFINDDGKFYFVDFKMKNKIIEFDGIYWHVKTNEKDIKRNEVYCKLGYDLLIINEDDLIKNKVNDELIENCLKFLRNED